MDSTTEEIKDFIRESVLVKATNHSSYMMVNCTDMQVLEAIMTSDKMKV